MVFWALGMGHGERERGKGKRVRGKGERLNLFLFPLTFNLFPYLPQSPIHPTKIYKQNLLVLTN